LEGPIEVSRDGRRLTCVRAINYSNLWLTQRADGSPGPSPAPLTEGTASIGDIRLSPDRLSVAYLKDEGGVRDVHVLSLRGGSDRRLTFLRSDASSVAWSPDGQTLAFTAPDGGFTRVWTVPASGGKPAVFQHSLVSGSFGEIAWAPGREILYQTDANRRIRALDPQSGLERDVLPGDYPGWVFCPVWSPDGNRFAFTRYLPPLTVHVGSNADSVPLRLIDAPILPWVWDPDGRSVLAWAAKSIIRIAYPSGDTTVAVNVPPGVMGPETGSRHPLDFSADLSSFVFKVSERKSDAWMLENFDPDVK